MANFNLTQISSSSNPFYSTFRQAAINNQGTVAYEGFLSPTLPPTAIFTSNGEQTTTIVDNNFYLQPGSLTASVVNSINDQGTVAYFSNTLNQSFSVVYSGVFTSNGQGNTTIIDSTSSPYNFFWSPALNNTGTLAFLAGQGNPATGQASIFTVSNGRLTNIASSSGNFSVFNSGVDTVGGNSPLSAYTLPSINDSGTVAFNAGLDAGGQGVFTSSNGVLTTVADSSGSFNNFSSADINNKGTVAFLAERDQGGRGIFTSSGGDVTTLIDDSGEFSYFNSDPSINDQGMVAFLGTTDTGVTGIFTGSDPTTDKVVAIGDELSGSTVQDLLITQNSLNNAGEVAFEAILADGREIIVRAEPVPEPSDGIVSVLALAILFILRLSWRHRKQFPKHAGH